MWLTVKECLEELQHFDDTQELAARLLQIAESSEPEEAYYLSEAATNMRGMANLMRSMAGRLQGNTNSTADSSPTKTEPRQDPQMPSTLLDLPQVLTKTRIGRTSWLKRVSEGTAPKPFRMGRRTMWTEHEINHWIATHIAQQRPSES